jgi:protein TonB
MSWRYPAAALSGAAVTFLILSLMQTLVTSDVGELKEIKAGRIVDFVRLKKAAEPEVKKRELPNRAQPEKPPPAPDVDTSNVPQPGALEVSAAIPDLSAGLDLAGGPGMAAAAASDADAVPLVRVSPQYPARAMQRGVEGWVHLRFTVTEAGAVKDAVVVAAEPANYFEQAALTAVGKYRYKPKIDDGRAVERPGVELVMSFRLER